MVIDIILIATFLIAIIYGYKKGILRMGISAVSLILTIVVSLILYIPLTNIIINTTGIDETLQNYIYEKAMDALNSQDSEKQNSQLALAIKNNSIETTAKALSYTIIRIVTFLILMIIVKLILRIFNGLADLLDKLPFVKGLNHILGGVFSLIMYFLIVELVFAIISVYTTLSPKNGLYNAVENSNIGKYLYSNNILTSSIEK